MASSGRIQNAVNDKFVRRFLFPIYVRLARLGWRVRGLRKAILRHIASERSSLTPADTTPAHSA